MPLPKPKRLRRWPSVKLARHLHRIPAHVRIRDRRKPLPEIDYSADPEEDHEPAEVPA